MKKKIFLIILFLLIPVVVQCEIKSFKFWIEGDNFKGRVVTTNNFLAYHIGFDSDNNPETGYNACGYPGIDYEISFSYQGGKCDPVVLFHDYSNYSCSPLDSAQWNFEENGKVFNFTIPLNMIYKGTFHINICLSYFGKIFVSGAMLADDQIIDTLNLDIRCDFDKDCDVDGSDLAIFSSSFGKNFK